MKEDNNIPENRLAKWLEGTLTPEELKAFENSKDFEIYQKIADETATLKLPKPNLKEKFEEQLIFNNKLKTSPKIIKMKPIRPWMYAVAAGILLFFGLQLFLNQDTVITTNFAENKTITLPDNSTVIINAGSEIRYNADTFLASRHIQLLGEAYFKVEKGSQFKVQTTHGSIQVLGTKFNVYSRNTMLKVFCDEGKVAVVSQKDSLVLTKGMGAFTQANTKLQLTPIDFKSPQWQNGKLIFYRASLAEVLAEIEIQFDVSINADTIDINRLYTGTFKSDNLEAALNAVCIPMNISYTIADDNVQLQNK